MINLENIKSVIGSLKLNDDDLIYGVFNPDISCTKCKGSGISNWVGDESILCDCMSTYKTEEYISFKTLKNICFKVKPKKSKRK